MIFIGVTWGYCVILQARACEQKVAGSNPVAGRVMPPFNPWARPLNPVTPGVLHAC